MKLQILKQEALDYLKENLANNYEKYFSNETNQWIIDLFDEDPFITFKEVPDFILVNRDSGLSGGQIDFNNCKILYKHLNF